MSSLFRFIRFIRFVRFIRFIGNWNPRPRLGYKNSIGSISIRALSLTCHCKPVLSFVSVYRMVVLFTLVAASESTLNFWAAANLSCSFGTASASLTSVCASEFWLIRNLYDQRFSDLLAGIRLRNWDPRAGECIGATREVRIAAGSEQISCPIRDSELAYLCAGSPPFVVKDSCVHIPSFAFWSREDRL